MYQGIIFDLDGTLWDSTLQILPAWNAVLKRQGLKRQLSHQDVKSFMGKTAVQIAQLMLPEKDLEVGVNIVKECCSEELLYLRKTGGTLYPHLEEVLTVLYQRHSLHIVSNCQEGYIETFFKAHRLSQYFTDHQCEGHSGRSKGENIKEVIHRNKLTSSIYVGDTQGDLDAADFAGIPFIHVAYGFGQVNRSVPKIENLTELRALCD